MHAFDIGINRDGGLTHVLDKGLGVRAWEDILETSGDYIDIVKLGWGTAWVTKGLERKLEVLSDKRVVIGGTFFEVVYARDKFDDYKRWLTQLGLDHVEISDGTVEIPRERKLELIADFARDFTVLSEVGSKDSEVVFAPYEWVEWIKEEKEAGAWKVITEGREGGTAGIFRPTGEMRTGLVDEIVHEIDFHDLGAHGALHRAARFAVRRSRHLRQGRLPRRRDRADANARHGLLRDRGRSGRARDHADRRDRGSRVGGAHARVPVEVPRQGLRTADGRNRRARQLALPRRPGGGEATTGGDP